MLVLLTIAAQPVPPPPRNAPPLVRTTIVPAPPVTPVPARQPGNGTPARAVASLASYITDEDYPAEAIRMREQGTTGIQLDIGVDGRVVGCTVVQSSGSATLDSTTCRLLRSRARFTPARDAGGRPVGDTTTVRIRWQLPTRIVPDLVVTRFEITGEGTARNCRMSARYHGGREQSLTAPACDRPNVPERLVAALKSQSRAKVSQVRQELTLVREAAAPWPSLQSGQDRMVAEARARLQVEPGGTVTSCTVLDSYSLVGVTPQPCNGVQAVTDDGVKETREMRLVLRVVLENEPKPR